MATSTWLAKCKKCGGEVYYYPSKILLESKKAQEEDDLRPRVVDCKCEGDANGIKHPARYNFPKEFEKIA